MSEPVTGMQNFNDEFLNTVPDLSSEVVLSGLFSMLSEVYNAKMPFNKLLGVKVEKLDLEKAVISIESREDLYGNYVQKILHGGVISSIIDLSGGIIAQTHALSLMKGLNIGQMMHRFSMMSTLNMRVDYLRPGSGEKFECISRIVRTGNKVAVAQMELLNKEKKQIAIGTGSYLIG